MNFYVLPYGEGIYGNIGICQTDTRFFRYSGDSEGLTIVEIGSNENCSDFEMCHHPGFANEKVNEFIKTLPPDGFYTWDIVLSTEICN